MSHIHTRKVCTGKYPFAGKEWWYEYSSDFHNFEASKIKKYIADRQKSFTKLTKVWDCELNSEWTVRIFFAAKMILAASLKLSALEYARSKNLNICVPYLQYYSLLYSLKSLVLTLPEQKWNNGKLIPQSHKSTINVACDEIAKIDPSWNQGINGQSSVKEKILRVKAFREMISYRAPSNGKKHGDFDFDVFSLCQVPVQLAQMVSEIFEESLIKHLPDDFKPTLNRKDLCSVYHTDIDGFEFFDEEDAYRIDYLFRKYPMPTNILHIMSEGHVEDFFGSWCEDDPKADSFDPDDNWRILFEVSKA